MTKRPCRTGLSPMMDLTSGPLRPEESHRRRSSWVDSVRSLGLRGWASPRCLLPGIMHGRGGDVSITSEPAGAEVFVAGRRIARTPALANLKRKRFHQVVETDGGSEILQFGERCGRCSTRFPGGEALPAEFLERSGEGRRVRVRPTTPQSRCRSNTGYRPGGGEEVAQWIRVGRGGNQLTIRDLKVPDLTMPSAGRWAVTRQRMVRVDAGIFCSGTRYSGEVRPLTTVSTWRSTPVTVRS